MGPRGGSMGSALDSAAAETQCAARRGEAGQGRTEEFLHSASVLPDFRLGEGERPLHALMPLLCVNE